MSPLEFFDMLTRTFPMDFVDWKLLESTWESLNDRPQQVDKWLTVATGHFERLPTAPGTQ